MATKRGLPSKRMMRHDRHFVDELTQRMGEGIGRMIRVSSIVSNDNQPRSHLGDLSELVASIDRHGILEPLLVRRLDNGRYELVSGERRFNAATELGLAEVPCIELSISDEQAVEIALVENLQRKDLSAFEEGDGFRTLIDQYKYTHEQVAEAVGKSRVTVTETLKLLVIPEDIREECRHADISAKGILLEIAKAGSREAMKRLVQEIIENNLGRGAIRERRQEIDTGETGASSDSPTTARRRPFVFRFRHPEQNFSFALSFKTEEPPDSHAVISALEDMIQELKQDLENGS